MLQKISNTASISERRAQYPLHERLVVYNTESMQRKMEIKSASSVPIPNPTSTSFTVNGVNILNKNSLDSDIILNRIVQRRQTHNRVERRRRDRMNNLFNTLSKCIPSIQHKENNSRADVLQEAIEYIRLIRAENYQLKYGTLPNYSPSEDDDMASVTSSTSSTDSSMISSPRTNNDHSLSFDHNNGSSVSATINGQSNRSNKPTVLKLPQSHFESILSFQ